MSVSTADMTRHDHAEPFQLFDSWFKEAEAKEPNDANAMGLATVGPDGMPSLRMVLLKGVDERGFVFYTNYESRKGQQLMAHRKAALTFHWKSLRRSVRIEGDVGPYSLRLGDGDAVGHPSNEARGWTCPIREDTCQTSLDHLEVGTGDTGIFWNECIEHIDITCEQPLF